MQHKADLPALTAVRFFAALAVFGFHFYPRGGIEGWLADAVEGGRSGVSLFFILSGFILVYAARPNDTARSFWIRRFARIYPMYFVAWLLFGCYLWLALAPTDFVRLLVFGGLPAALLLQSWLPKVAPVWNWPGWSLSTEAFFYSVFPLLYRWSTARKSLGSWLSVLLIANLALLVLFQYLSAHVLPVELLRGTPLQTRWSSFLATFPLMFVSQFALGVVLGGMFLRRGPIHRGWWTIAALACVGVLAAPKEIVGVPRDALLALVFCALVYSLASARMSDNLCSRALVLLGQASYSFYVLQSPVWKLYCLALDMDQKPTSLAQIGIFLVVLTALSIAGYSYIERPMERWIRSKVAQPISTRRQAGVEKQGPSLPSTEIVNSRNYQ